MLFPDRKLGNVIVSSGTNLSAGMPPEAGEAFQKDLNGAFSGLMEGAVSAKTKRERPEILDLVKAKFMVDDNFPKHVYIIGESSQRNQIACICFWCEVN